MARTSKHSVESQFRKPAKAETELLMERRLAERARDDKVGRLRALRMAKDGAQRDAATAKHKD